jgi:MSHA biogenesis protein MshP
VEVRGLPAHASSLTSRSCQQGFSLITAIFLLVVIAALGTFAVTLSTTQNQSQAVDAMAARGYQAALAGIEVAAYNVALPSVAWTAGCPAMTVVSLTDNRLAPFTVTVSCSANSHVEGSTTFWVYAVSSVAKTAGAPGDMNYVEQIATAKLVQ